MSRLPRVYMAGKIKAGDWRHSLLKLRGLPLVYDARHDYVEPVDSPIVDGFEYAGPFFISDDHGCYHGRNQHGLVAGGCASESENYVRGWTSKDHGSSLTRRVIHRSCLHWLDSADVVFCWLESLDAYGTLVELGYAHARGIPIYLAPDSRISMDALVDLEYDPRGVHFRSPLDDLWFATMLASEYESDLDVRFAWKDFGEWWMRRGWSGEHQRRRLSFVVSKP